MLAKTCNRIFVLGVVLTVCCASVYAQQKVYKWVDKDGVVHLSDSPPAASESADTEILTTEKSPTYVPPAQPAAKSPAVSQAEGESQSAKIQVENPPLAEKVNIAEMSLEDLDRRCDDAREKMIAPLREAEIADCKQQKRDDPAWCERFNADFGDGGRTVSGAIRPRMFDDLPECVEALQERNRRGR